MTRPLVIGAQPERFRGTAGFLDGNTALLRPAEIGIEEGAGTARLVITPRGVAPVRWPLASVRQLRDQAGRDLMILTAGRDAPERLIVEGAEERRILSARCPSLHRAPPVSGAGRLIGWAMAAVVSVALILWGLLPVLADRLASALPPEGERVLGERTLEQVRMAFRQSPFGPLPLCEDRQGRAALDRMTGRLTDGLDLPYPVSVHVLDLDMINAVALPGGIVVLFDGLLQEAAGPDQVAAVLAHEVGHVAARDPTRIALRTAGSVGVLGLLLGDFAGGTVVLFLTERLIRADYTREAEAAADAFAHRLLAGAGIPPAALGDMFRVLRDEVDGEAGIVSHFASHPALDARIAAAEAANALLDGPARPALGDADWTRLRGICR